LATVVVSKGQEYGEVGSVQMVVHVPAPAGERWTVTEGIPEPPSEAVTDSVIVRRRYAPGSVSMREGAVLSTRRLATVAEYVMLPALSVETERRS
jgi:hypothetical protein